LCGKLSDFSPNLPHNQTPDCEFELSRTKVV
jgi:hypothetical protein